MNKKKVLLIGISVVLFLVGVMIFLVYRLGAGVYVSENGASFSIIGGADGPTSVFIAGKLGGGNEKETEDETRQEAESMKAEVITAAEAKKMMDQESGYVILDVREADEYAEGHIKGAIQLSYTELEAKAESVLTDKNQLILIYCRSGRRSAIAGETLCQMGYTNLRDFGGILDWPYDVVQGE